MDECNITAERLRQVVSYNQETGIFTRLIATSNRVTSGEHAGRNNGNGYLRIMIDGRNYYAHRLAWLYVNGKMPSKHLDHIDGHRSNNKIDNLREATHQQNHQNLGLRATNKSGHTGVSWSGTSEKWTANIWANNKRHYLGCFDSIEEAAAAYSREKIRLHDLQPVLRDA